MPWLRATLFPKQELVTVLCVLGSGTFVLQIAVEARPNLLRLEQVSQGLGLHPGQLLPLLFQAGAEHLGSGVGHQGQGQQGVLPSLQVPLLESLTRQSWRERGEQTNF